MKIHFLHHPISQFSLVLLLLHVSTWLGTCLRRKGIICKIKSRPTSWTGENSSHRTHWNTAVWLFGWGFCFVWLRRGFRCWKCFAVAATWGRQKEHSLCFSGCRILAISKAFSNQDQSTGRDPGGCKMKEDAGMNSAAPLFPKRLFRALDKAGWWGVTALWKDGSAIFILVFRGEGFKVR